MERYNNIPDYLWSDIIIYQTIYDQRYRYCTLIDLFAFSVELTYAVMRNKRQGGNRCCFVAVAASGSSSSISSGKPKKEQRVIRRPKGNRCSGSGSRFRSGFRSGTGVVLGVLLRGVVLTALTALTALTCVDLR